MGDASASHALGQRGDEHPYLHTLFAASGAVRAQAAGPKAIFWRVLPKKSRTYFLRAVVVHNGFTELTARPFSRSARHDSKGLSQAYEDRVVPFELGAVQVLEDRNDPFDREPGALENT